MIFITFEKVMDVKKEEAALAAIIKSISAAYCEHEYLINCFTLRMTSKDALMKEKATK